MSKPRWLSSPEMRAWLGYLEATNLLERRLERQLQDEAGLSHPQYDILATLSASPERRMRMTELAAAVIVSKSGLTYQVGKLEKAGFVRRQADPCDERGVLAVLTEEGVELLRRVAPGHVRTVRTYLIDLLSPQQLTQLTEITEAMTEKLRDAGQR
ncbi:MarR family winged helix-turn-helix transcriptional regulator [Allokutzneria oryzae]|uniref:MarR family winged helix-turn-helix transcriptional regulator n=1 Tax=Allokutzneria oryzae TaxID=1378989 RepID=A0ABV6A854_9PSEU